MEAFGDEFRQKYPDPDLDKIEKTLESLVEWRMDGVDVREISPVAKLPWKIFEILQVGLRRSVELAESAIREMNRENVSSSFVLTRAVYETTCLLWYAVRKIQKVALDDDTTALEEADKFLMDVLMGAKTKDWMVTEEYKARNVLTAIQSLDKQFNMDGKFMWFYEGLSERAHPNYLGMMGLYALHSSPDDPMVRFVDGRNEDKHFTVAIGSLSIALGMMETALDEYDGVHSRFAALCERHLYEQGIWPDSLAYPIERVDDEEEQ